MGQLLDGNFAFQVDSIVGNLGLPKVDILIIDTEGADPVRLACFFFGGGGIYIYIQIYKGVIFCLVLLKCGMSTMPHTTSIEGKYIL